MAKLQKREKIMLGATSGLLVAFFLYQFVFTKTDDPPPQTGSKKVAQKSLPASVQKPFRGKAAGKPVTANASFGTLDIQSWGRDPFHEAYRLEFFDISQTDSSTQLVLKGIIWRGNNAFVLINDNILRKGERMGNLKILDIKKERVICKLGNNLVTLFLDDEK